MAGNFEFLRNKFPDLAENGAKAESYLDSDNKACMSYISAIFDSALKHICKFNGIDTSTEDKYAEWIVELRTRGIIDYNMNKTLHDLRIARNAHSHNEDNSFTASYRQTLLAQCLTVCTWLNNKYGSTQQRKTSHKSQKSAASTPPPPSSQKTASNKQTYSQPISTPLQPKVEPKQPSYSSTSATKPKHKVATKPQGNFPNDGKGVTSSILKRVIVLICKFLYFATAILIPGFFCYEYFATEHNIYIFFIITAAFWTVMLVFVPYIWNCFFHFDYRSYLIFFDIVDSFNAVFKHITILTLFAVLATAFFGYQYYKGNTVNQRIIKRICKEYHFYIREDNDKSTIVPEGTKIYAGYIWLSWFTYPHIEFCEDGIYYRKDSDSEVKYVSYSELKSGKITPIDVVNDFDPPDRSDVYLALRHINAEIIVFASSARYF